MISISFYDSPLGRLLMRAEDEAATGLWFVGQQHFPAELASAAYMNEDSEALARLRLWLDEYFSGGRPDISRLSLAPGGSQFRRAVWDILCQIPYGSSMSYGQIARRLEARLQSRVSAQAVGGAVAHNPISIVIPCHRVLGAGGKLCGYAGGLDKKAALLSLEGISFTE